MSRIRPIALAALLLAAAGPAAAQTWDRYGGYDPAPAYAGDWRPGPDRRGDRHDSVPTTFDWRSQLDRPGDWRCDAYWDAGRTDCHEGWRDQRHRASPQARRDYRALAGYGGGYESWRGYGRDRSWSWRAPYGHAPTWSHAAGGTTWHGAYGRPDIVFPAGAAHGARDPRRIDWCRSAYRSYDPASGYYRAWSGRLVWCG